VRAVLGHQLFGYIHPYPDGNGRMARFLMNVLLASGGSKTAMSISTRTLSRSRNLSRNALALALNRNSHVRKVASMGAATGHQ
jgi:Fic family protein